MSAEIFLIAPTEIAAESLKTALRAAFDQHEIAALLLPRGQLADSAYKALCKNIVPIAQAGGAAVLVEGEPGFVRLVGADGLHVADGIKAVKEALSAVKPDLIVGAGDVGSRDDAMGKGELGVDYILFGPLSGSISPEAREMAHWWAETMEIPSVLSDPDATISAFEAEGCEFIGLPLAVAEPAR